MGYHSNIVIAIDPTVYKNSPPDVQEAFEEVFGTPSLEEEDRIIFNHDFIKWYDSDPSVAIIDNWLGSLDECQYGLIELGEDYSDVRMQGEYWNYDLGFVRKITF